MTMMLMPVVFVIQVDRLNKLPAIRCGYTADDYDADACGGVGIGREG